MSALLLLGWCGLNQEQAQEYNPHDNPYLGNMDDHSYSGLVTPRSVVTRVNGEGRSVAMDQFRGSFVWVDYSASFGQSCAAQAMAIKSVEQEVADTTVFLTIMTSKSTNYNDVPNQETARVWADRFGFDRFRVLAAANLWAWTVPTHILYSPEGQTLYRTSGYLTADQIRYIHSRFVQEWKLYSTTGQTARWMVFGTMARPGFFSASGDTSKMKPWVG